MATEIEYELTFLASGLPHGLEETQSVLIHDVYVPVSANHAVLRLRQTDDKYVITKKQPIHDGDSSKQLEHTIELSREEFEALTNCSNKDFVKRRYYMELNGYPAEIDVYQEKLTGLVTIDFEFDSEVAKNSFVAPDFVLADVTQEEAIAGGFLAGKSIDDIMPKLKRYGYKKIH